MRENIFTKLLFNASKALCEAPMQHSDQKNDNEIQLIKLLSLRNGFYAFGKALLFRPMGGNNNCPMNIEKWNHSETWKCYYVDDFKNDIFFAEDIFGIQFAIHLNEIYLFDPETAKWRYLAKTMEEFIKLIIAKPSDFTGDVFESAWEQINGPLHIGCRLIPKIPFVCGGEFEVKNFISLPDEKGMRIRAGISNQIAGIKDGEKIIFKIAD